MTYQALSSEYRLDILMHVEPTNGGTYWVWTLTHVHGDRRDGGSVDDLSGTYDLDGGDLTAEAERVADQVCDQCDVDRTAVLLVMPGRSDS